MKRLSPAWFLFLFAPLTAEYVSGSSEFINPFILLANLLLYGPGALLIREWRVRRHKGWLAVFILAVAYVIAEEGLMLNTLFDPSKNTTGRWQGVNWVWTVGMLMIHTLLSIFMPILLAEALYHKRADEPWLKPRHYYLLLSLFLANVFGLGRLLAPLHRPGTTYLLIQLGIIGACLVLATIVPGPPAAPGETKPQRSARWWYWIALGGMFITMLVGVLTPNLPVPGVAMMVIMIVFYLAFLLFLRRNQAFDPGLDPFLKLALASGIITFWILLSPLMSVAKGSPGPLLFGLLAANLLWRERKRLKAELQLQVGGCGTVDSGGCKHGLQ